MNKEELIKLLESRSTTGCMIDGWKRLSKDDDNYWTYYHATADTMEPIVIVTDDGIVKYKCQDDQEEYTYKEFAAKFLSNTRHHYKKKDIRNDMDHIGNALTNAGKDGLECEVVLFALKHMKNKPTSTIEEAMIAGLAEWDLL